MLKSRELMTVFFILFFLFWEILPLILFFYSSFWLLHLFIFYPLVLVFLSQVLYFFGYPVFIFQIRVTFVNELGVEEAGIDGGGIFKDFMENITRAAFDIQYGLFKVIIFAVSLD